MISTPARRAHEPPGRARGDVVGELHAGVGAHRAHRLARPLLPGRRHGLHDLVQAQAAVLLRRQLHHVPAGEGGATSEPDIDGGAAAAKGGAPEEVHLKVWPRQQEDGAAGAVAHEAAGQAYPIRIQGKLHLKKCSKTVRFYS